MLTYCKVNLNSILSQNCKSVTWFTEFILFEWVLIEDHVIKYLGLGNNRHIRKTLREINLNLSTFHRNLKNKRVWHFYSFPVKQIKSKFVGFFHQNHSNFYNRGGLRGGTTNVFGPTRLYKFNFGCYYPSSNCNFYSKPLTSDIRHPYTYITQSI